MDFCERRSVLACYEMEAAAPERRPSSSAGAPCWAEHSLPPPARRVTLFQPAQLVEGRSPDRWILYRIVRDDGRTSTAARSAAA